MRKTIKRLGAVLLAMAMAVSVLCTGALAAESTYTLTIQDSNKDHKYTAYQVFAGTVQDTTEGKKQLNVTGWGSGVDTSKKVGDTGNEKTLVQAIQAITVDDKTPFAGKTEPGDIAAVLGAAANNSKDSTVATAFADVVANYVTGSGHSTTDWTPTADGTPAHYKIANLTGGYYFVKSDNEGGKTDVANTRYMLEVVGDATVAAKNGVPTVDKTVQNTNNTNKDFADTTTAQVGQTVNFKLTGTLPSNYDYYKNYAYTFDDTLSEGLTLTEEQKNALFVKVYASQEEAEKDANGTDNNTGTKLTAKSGNTGDYTVTVTSNSAAKTTSLKVAFADLKTIKKTDGNDALITKDSVIVVYYSATINGSATAGGAGNQNSVKLEYSNDPNNTGTGTTTPDNVSVFTFKLDITKTKKDEAGIKLAGAKFVLSTSDKLDIGVADNDSDLTDTNVTNQLIKVTGTTPDYVINDGTNASAAGQYIMATAAATGDNLGKLNITGLNKGVYYLYETKAPEGYNRITEPIKIEITEATTTEKNANGEFSVTSLKYKINDDADAKDGNTSTGVISANVENTSGSTLPSTGGMGTKLFYTIGGILMAGAAIVLVVRKRRSDAE